MGVIVWTARVEVGDGLSVGSGGGVAVGIEGDRVGLGRGVALEMGRVEGTDEGGWGVGVQPKRKTMGEINSQIVAHLGIAFSLSALFS